MRKTILIISILLTSLVAQSALFGLFGTTIDTSDRGITISDISYRRGWTLPGQEKEDRFFAGNLLNRYASITITQVTVQITVKGCNNYGCKTYDTKEVDLFTPFQDDDLLPNQARNFSKKFEHYVPQGEHRYSYKVIKVKGF